MRKTSARVDTYPKGLMHSYSTFLLKYIQGCWGRANAGVALLYIIERAAGLYLMSHMSHIMFVAWVVVHWR